MKFCKKCSLYKELTSFGKQSSCKDGTRNTCKVCISVHKSKWYLFTREERLIQMKDWQKVNKDYSNNTKKNYNKQRYKTDIQFKIKARLRSRLGHALQKGIKSGSAVADLGCSIEEFKTYIESKFYLNKNTNEQMNWDNWSKSGWQLDHIKPLYKFDLSNAIEFKEACHYTNLQPLWHEDHLNKTAKDKEDFYEWTKRSNNKCN